jgi:eukaryotic-like serine/threonine-protein kinase
VLGEISGGRYALSDLLGSGGMAEVFLAHDRILGRDLALKVLREDYANDAAFVSRFQREAVSAAALNHPYVVQVYDQGRSEDGRLYIAMEHVPGGNLGDLITRRGPLDPAEAARLASQVAEALGAAHERGIVHRDVKPQNVLLDEAGEAKVTDFGIALAASSTSTTSGTNRVFGTARYISPEQAMGERVGPESDLYSLGVVLYEMLTGVVPFEAEGALATALKHVTDRPISPRERDPSVPEALDTLVMGLLAKDPENRYGSAFELAEDLRTARAELPPAFFAGAARHLEAQRESVGTEGGVRPDSSESAPRSRRPVAMGLVALAALLVLGTFGWGLTGSPEGPKGVVAASEGARDGGAPAAPKGSGDAREGASGEGVGSALPSVDLANGPYVPASSSAPPSASASVSASAPASASPSASAPAWAPATPEAQASEPVASAGPWAPASASASPAAQGRTSGSGGKDAGTMSPTVVESAAREQYR